MGAGFGFFGSGGRVGRIRVCPLKASGCQLSSGLAVLIISSISASERLMLRASSGIVRHERVSLIMSSCSRCVRTMSLGAAAGFFFHDYARRLLDES